MADKEIYKKYKLGDMSAIYIKDTKSGCVGLTILPADLENQVELEGWWNIEPAVQVKMLGDNHSDGWAQGHSMRNSQSTNELKFVEQKTDGNKIITTYERRGVKISHVLQYNEADLYFTSYTILKNEGTEKVGIEMISSFNISAYPILGKGLRQEDLVLHRMQSKWSMEGKLQSQPFLDLNLEPAWLRIGANSIRFGEVGSMPVRRYFPWMIVEDKKYNYSIGVQLAHPCSWQMEVYNKDEKNALSGGLADREFGHWFKYLEPGTTFETPKATLTVAKEDIDGISYRLTSSQWKNLENVPEVEKSLPVVFNEYCTTWGNPTEANMAKIAEKLKGHGLTYCVIDAGWHVKDGCDWSDIGDWITNKTRFPNGLKATADKIKECGMIPGIWYEMENCANSSEMFKNEDMLLKRDGIPLQACQRRFLDMRKPENHAYLTERLINNLKENGYGYLKVDYNDNIGIGCDGAESLGEGLRQNMEGSQAFFKKIRQEIPEIVIENCASGGHRLEPSMQAITSMASFSDAHEWENIPVVAANVTRAILPAQSQIWAVLRAKDSDTRLHYSLANTFFGRMCLSGDIYDLSDEQWAVVDEAIAMYKRCSMVIKNGRNYRYGNFQNYYNKLSGYQAVARVSEKDNKQLVVVNTFANAEKNVEISLPENSKNWSIEASFNRKEIEIECNNNKLYLKNLHDFDGIVVLLRS